MTYEEFERDYRAFISSLPGTVNLPNGYFQNMRGWDYWMVCERAGWNEIGGANYVLDVGALHTFFAVFLAKTGRVWSITTSDNFAWAEREYAKGLMTPWEWRCVVERLGGNGLVTACIDLEHIDVDLDYTHVLCISTIEHVHDDRKAMLEMMRVLKPGGKLLLTTEYNPDKPKPYSETDGSYYRIYDDLGVDTLTADLNVTHRAICPDDYGNPFHTLFLEITKE